MRVVELGDIVELGKGKTIWVVKATRAAMRQRAALVDGLDRQVVARLLAAELGIDTSLDVSKDMARRALAGEKVGKVSKISVTKMSRRAGTLHHMLWSAAQADEGWEVTEPASAVV